MPEQLANGLPYLSGVLRSERAIHVNIAIMRAFVKNLGMPVFGAPGHRTTRRQIGGEG